VYIYIAEPDECIHEPMRAKCRLVRNVWRITILLAHNWRAEKQSGL